MDLAVGVAHAGGVDPETSHSTVEMRRAIVEFNLPLFWDYERDAGRKPCADCGKRGSYSIHLGSGVIHQQGRGTGSICCPSTPRAEESCSCRFWMKTLRRREIIQDRFICPG